MITIKPYGGIGNRIRTLDSVIAFTQQDKTPVTLIWEKSPTLNCDFEKLFEIPDYITVINKDGLHSTLAMKSYAGVRKILGLAGIRLPFGYKKYILEKEMKRLREIYYDFYDLNHYDSVYIETQHRFFSIGKDFESIKAVAQIQERVNKITELYSDNTIGVHIRRTDNLKSVLNSPVGLFIDLMKETVSSDSNARFFLATDSPEVESELQGIFSERIILQPDKKLGRDNPDAIQDALVDMLCLSKTKRIIGSFWSSFSETAASMGKIDLQIVKI
jgi:hypothetical protein